MKTRRDILHGLVGCAVALPAIAAVPTRKTAALAGKGREPAPIFVPMPVLYTQAELAKFQAAWEQAACGSTRLVLYKDA